MRISLKLYGKVNNVSKPNQVISLSPHTYIHSSLGPLFAVTRTLTPTPALAGRAAVTCDVMYSYGDALAKLGRMCALAVQLCSHCDDSMAPFAPEETGLEMVWFSMAVTEEWCTASPLLFFHMYVAKIS